MAPWLVTVPSVRPVRGPSERSEKFSTGEVAETAEELTENKMHTANREVKRYPITDSFKMILKSL
jgi:hypothetical protein